MKFLEAIQIIRDYLKLDQKITPADCLIGFGTLDLRVAEKTSELFLSGYWKTIIFTWGLGKITQLIRNEPEAEKFAKVAINHNIPKNSIYIENKSSNTGENIKFTKELIKNNNIKINKTIVITNPFNERRLYATLKKQYPELNFKVTSPQYTLNEYIDFYKNSSQLTIDDLINLMVGRIQRMKEYAKNWFQIKQNIPRIVIDAYQELIKLWYNKQLIKK